MILVGLLVGVVFAASAIYIGMRWSISAAIAVCLLGSVATTAALLLIDVSPAWITGYTLGAGMGAVILPDPMRQVAARHRKIS